MSNGLCHLQGQRGFVLSRASCTDRSWDSCGSYKYCSEQFLLPMSLFDLFWSNISVPYNKKSGFPIVAAHYNGSKTEHCCGTASWDNKTKKTDCGSFKSVSVPSGTAIPGVAGLAMNSSSSPVPSSTATPVPSDSGSNGSNGSNTSRETAIGVGVGVPLGLIALASIAWALWERRSRLHAALNVPPTYVTQPSPGTVYQLSADDRPAELGSSVVSELANSAQHKSHGGSVRWFLPGSSAYLYEWRRSKCSRHVISHILTPTYNYLPERGGSLVTTVNNKWARLQGAAHHLNCLHASTGRVQTSYTYANTINYTYLL